MISLHKLYSKFQRISAVSLAVPILFLCFAAPIFSAETGVVCFKDFCVHPEIARTSIQKQRGLSGRQKLNEGQGMLFTYDYEVWPNFWMKNMLIPLDFIWLNGQGEVVNISERIPPCGTNSCPTITSPKMVQYVLELPSGSIQKVGIKIGDHAAIKLGKIS